MRRYALPLIAGLVTFFVIATGGVAYALWSTQAEQDISASAATIGIEQTTSFTGTPTDTYDEPSGTLAHAYEITIENSGSRAADYRLAVAPQFPSDPALPSAITIAIGTAGTCAPTAPLSSPQGGLLANSPSYDGTSLGQLAPGATVTLCVISTIDSADFQAFDGQQVTLALTSGLRWSSASPAWTATSTSATVLQIVTAETSGWVPVIDVGGGGDPGPPPAPGDELTTWMLVTHPIGRFWADQAYRDSNGSIVVNGRVCKNGGNERPALYASGDCGDGWNSQLRPTPIPGTEMREWWLLRADPSYLQPNTPAWTRTDTLNRIGSAARSNESNAQRWHLETDGQGLFRFTAVGEPTDAPLCITAGTTNVNNGGSNPPYFLTTEACDESSTRQTFRLHLIGYPVPDSALYATCNNEPVDVFTDGYPLGYSGNGSTNNFNFTWKECYAQASHANYQQETLYRLVFRTSDVPGGTTNPLTSVISHFYNSGGWRVIQMGNNAGTHSDSGLSMNHKSNLAAWWIDTFGNSDGTHTADAWVEQRITELGAWYTTTQRLHLQIVRAGSNFTITVLP